MGRKSGRPLSTGRSRSLGQALGHTEQLDASAAHPSLGRAPQSRPRLSGAHRSSQGNVILVRCVAPDRWWRSHACRPTSLKATANHSKSGGTPQKLPDGDRDLCGEREPRSALSNPRPDQRVAWRHFVAVDASYARVYPQDQANPPSPATRRRVPGSNLVMGPAEVTSRSVDAPCKVMVDRVPPRYHWFTLKVTSSPAAFCSVRWRHDQRLGGRCRRLRRLSSERSCERSLRRGPRCGRRPVSTWTR